jgi:hypothetical protein
MESKPLAKVHLTGRIGEVIIHDPTDDCLAYKLKFSDGLEPQMDWFASSTVECVSDITTLSSIWPQSVKEDGKENMPAAWVNSRPAGTPVMDEGFICMGGRAPICPPPAGKQTSGPITLDVLQGKWLGSSGAQIQVACRDVLMNGMPLKAHKVELFDDGTVRSIGSLWQLDKWGENGSLEFRCSSERKDMACYKLEVWTPGSDALGTEAERLKLMGYAGSAKAPLARGIEGCLPGTLGAEVRGKDAEDVKLLTDLISMWREPALRNVCCRQVVPDATNRSQTGLGVELVHFVASSIQKSGFKKRKGTKGHDIPVLVLEPLDSEFRDEAVGLWKERVAEDEGFPPVRVHLEEDLFTSLGNGHFFQALNLFDCEWPAINDDTGRLYRVGDDADLAEAISVGVPSIILRNQTPRPVRAKIAELLNSKRDFGWTLGEDGTVDVSYVEEDTSYCTQFEWLSKGMDAFQVNCLVRTHLGIRESKRIEETQKQRIETNGADSLLHHQ